MKKIPTAFQIFPHRLRLLLFRLIFATLDGATCFLVYLSRLRSLKSAEKHENHRKSETKWDFFAVEKYIFRLVVVVGSLRFNNMHVVFKVFFSYIYVFLLKLKENELKPSFSISLRKHDAHEKSRREEWKEEM